MNLFLQSKHITERILVIRNERIMLDTDLAEIYGVTTKVLNQAVKRNLKRFPPDLMFQLTPKEKLWVVTNCDHLHKLRFSSTLPYAFTEHGAIMLANTLRSERAIEMSLFVVRAFNQLKSLLLTHQDVLRKLKELGEVVGTHDQQLKEVIQMLHALFPKRSAKKRKIGFYVTTPVPE